VLEHLPLRLRLRSFRHLRNPRSFTPSYRVHHVQSAGSGSVLAQGCRRTRTVRESCAVGFADKEVDYVLVAVVAVRHPVHALNCGALHEEVGGSSSLDGSSHGLHRGKSECQCGLLLSRCAGHQLTGAFY
jgi:hypothetical protein